MGCPSLSGLYSYVPWFLAVEQRRCRGWPFGFGCHERPENTDERIFSFDFISRDCSKSTALFNRVYPDYHGYLFRAARGQKNLLANPFLLSHLYWSTF